jgi:hypothetical protein
LEPSSFNLKPETLKQIKACRSWGVVEQSWLVLALQVMLLVMI